MPRLLICFIALLSINLTGCANVNLNPLGTAKTSGEVSSGYTYIPVDPFPVVSIPGDDCGATPEYISLPDALPDNAVRMLIENLSESGSVTYLLSKAAAQNQRYRVTVDYINADTINVPIWLSLTMKTTKNGDLAYVDPISPPSPDFQPGTEVYDIQLTKPTPADLDREPGLQPYNIPVYVGIGLRVSANVYTVGANVNISGIGAIGAEADAQHLTGSLIVQTLGVNGKSIEAALPIQSDLNRTTAENAIVAVGTIKALLYASDTREKERIVGLYLPFSGGQPLVNALISAMSRNPVYWRRPCVVKLTASTATAQKTPGSTTAASTATAQKTPGSTTAGATAVTPTAAAQKAAARKAEARKAAAPAPAASTPVSAPSAPASSNN